MPDTSQSLRSEYLHSGEYRPAQRKSAAPAARNSVGRRGPESPAPAAGDSLARPGSGAATTLQRRAAAGCPAQACILTAGASPPLAAIHNAGLDCGSGSRAGVLEISAE